MLPKTFQQACIFVAEKYLSALEYDDSLIPKNYLDAADSLLSKIHKHMEDEEAGKRQRFFGWSKMATLSLHCLVKQSTIKDRSSTEIRSVIMCNALELMFKKQHDYGHGNITKFGEFGVLVRTNDKIARLLNLHARGDSPENESLIDSWVDLFNYSLISLLLHLNIFTLPFDENFSWENIISE